MSQTDFNSPKALPIGLIRVVSLAIAFHFLAVGALVLAAASGPWSTPRFGESTALGPFFAGKINDYFMPIYLEPLRLTHNYHFTDNRSLVSSVYFEARLKDAKGAVVQTMKFPDESANFWLRHRYGLLALGLGNDQPVQAPRGEMIQAPGDKEPKVTYWDTSDPKVWKLKKIDEKLIKDLPAPVMRPSEMSLLLARSYQRYLSRQYEAASVELVRHSKEPVLPAFMFGEGAPPGAFDELVCSFGEYRRENESLRAR
jgi:hypothetical protein